MLVACRNLRKSIGGDGSILSVLDPEGFQRYPLLTDVSRGPGWMLVTVDRRELFRCDVTVPENVLNHRPSPLATYRFRAFEYSEWV